MAFFNYLKSYSVVLGTGKLRLHHFDALGKGTPYNGLYGGAPPETGTFFRFQVHKGFDELKYSYINKYINKIYIHPFSKRFSSREMCI